jgi:hypothetical protein
VTRRGGPRRRPLDAEVPRIVTRLLEPVCSSGLRHCVGVTRRLALCAFAGAVTTGDPFATRTRA